MHKNIRILLICSILLHSGINLFLPVYAIYIKDIGGTLFETGAIIGFYAILKSILYFLFNKIDKEKFNKKAMISSGYFLFALGYTFYIFASKPMHILLIQGLLAMGEVIINPYWSAIIAIYLEKGKEKTIYSNFYGIRSFFEGIAAILGGLFAMRFGFNFMFMVMASFSFIATITSLFVEEKDK